MKTWKVWLRESSEQFGVIVLYGDLKIEHGVLVCTNEDGHITAACGPGYWQYVEPVEVEEMPAPKKNQRRRSR